MQSSLLELDSKTIELKPCHHTAVAEGLEVKFNFYHCEVRDECIKDKYQNLVDSRFRFEGSWDMLEESEGPKCCLDIANTCNKVGLKKLAEEAIENIGYAVRSVEWRIVWLNTMPYVINIEGEEEKATTDLMHINSRCKIIPLEFDERLKATLQYHQRSSAFYDCPLERFFPCLDKKIFPFEIAEREDSLGGQAEHKLQNWRFPDIPLIHEKLLVIAGLVKEPIPRDKYCELELEYFFTAPNGKKYVARGHPDAVLKITDKKTGELEGICILDFKHSRYSSYEKPLYKMQLLSYALAIKQMLDINPKYFLLVTQRSPHRTKPDSWRETQTLMTMVPNNPNNSLIQELHKDVEKYEGLIWDVITDVDSAVSCKEKYEAMEKNGCSTKGRLYDQLCFQKLLCDYLVGKAKEENIPILNLLKENKWLPADLAYQ